MNDLVSIVIPVYNMEDTIGNTIYSLLHQTYTNIELLVVNDGSTDNTKKKCEELLLVDSRITLINTDNRGSGPARNEGIKHASGKYIYFPDADDLANKTLIEKTYNALEKNDADLAVFGFVFCDQNGVETRRKEYPNISFEGDYVRNHYNECISYESMYTIQCAPWNKLFSLQIIKENNLEYPPLRRHQDEAFISRYMCFSNRIVFIDDVLYTHYINTLNMEWKKYPVDYYSCVSGLFEIWNNTILTWSDNESVREAVNKEYICKSIKALEMVYSPKAKDIKDKIKWINEKIELLNLRHAKKVHNLGTYQKIAMILIRRKMNFILLQYIRIKLFIQRVCL